jgi:hypothetical protein
MKQVSQDSGMSKIAFKLVADDYNVCEFNEWYTVRHLFQQVMVVFSGWENPQRKQRAQRSHKMLVLIGRAYTSF